jgi:hypothetical protein
MSTNFASGRTGHWTSETLGELDQFDFTRNGRGQRPPQGCEVERPEKAGESLRRCCAVWEELGRRFRHEDLKAKVLDAEGREVQMASFSD